MSCEKRPATTASGNIILPEGYTAIDRVQERAGRVVSKGRVSEDRKTLPGPGGRLRKVRDIRSQLDSVQVGDRVLFRGFLAEANNLSKQWKLNDPDGNEYAIIDIEDILGVIGNDVPIGQWGTLG